jgi:hypothetical protein
MILFISFLLLMILGCLTFLPAVRLLYARNPPLAGLLLTLVASFVGVYAALVFSRSEDRRDRMARAATLIEMTRESLSADKMEARILTQLRNPEWQAAEGPETEARIASVQPKELSDLLANGAVLEEISPQSLKALLECQVSMETDLKSLLRAAGRDRRRRLNAYLRELAFAQGVLAAEAEFQRGNIRRGDLSEILESWAEKKSAQAI